MKSNLIEYIKTMDNISFSTNEKEQMIEGLMSNEKKSKPGYRRKLNVGRLGLAIAACFIFFSLTAFAAGNVAEIVSGTNPFTATKDYNKWHKMEERAGFTARSVQSFSNGYEFLSMNTQKIYALDEEGNSVKGYKGIFIDYIRDNASPLISVSMDPAEMYNDDHASDTQTRVIDDITVHYNEDEYLFLPVSEEPTEAESARQEDDVHFFISYGSNERETKHAKSVNFEIEGISYVIHGFELDLTPDEMFDMAKEIIESSWSVVGK